MLLDRASHMQDIKNDSYLKLHPSSYDVSHSEDRQTERHISCIFRVHLGKRKHYTEECKQVRYKAASEILH